jgi:hypothetical protein
MNNNLAVNEPNDRDQCQTPIEIDKDREKDVGQQRD